MNEKESLRNLFVKLFGIDLPISGGDGQSVDDPIIIDAGSDFAKIESTVVSMIFKIAGKTYKMHKLSLLSHNGRMLDEYSVILDEDPDVVRSLYFDVT